MHAHVPAGVKLLITEALKGHFQKVVKNALQNKFAARCLTAPGAWEADKGLVGA